MGKRMVVEGVQDKLVEDEEDNEGGQDDKDGNYNLQSRQMHSQGDDMLDLQLIRFGNYGEISWMLDRPADV